MRGAFSVGAVLAAKTRVWIRRPFAFVALAVLPHLPLAVMLWGQLSVPRWWIGSVTATIAVSALAWYGGALVPAAGLSRGVAAALRCRGPLFRDLLEIRARDLVVGLGTAGPIAAARAAAAFASYWILAMGELASWRLLLLLVPPFLDAMICAALLVAVPAAVVERARLRTAIRRSLLLTRGHRGRILSILLLVAVGCSLITLAASRLIEALVDSSTPFGAGTERIWSWAATIGLRVVSDSFVAIVAAVSYQRLVWDRDGASAGELAEVFD